MRLKPLIFLSIVFILTVFLATLAWKISYPLLPKEPGKVLFYSNQLGDDLRLCHLAAVESAREKLSIQIFNFSDKKLISAVKEAQQRGCTLSLLTDKSAFSPLRRIFQATAYNPHQRGLMHRKIVAIDDHLLLVGSSNFTKESLQMHENLLFAFEAPDLVQAIEKEEGGGRSFSLEGQNVRLFLLPEDRSAQKELLRLIGTAKKTLQVAMFTWTSEAFAEAVIAAHKRGVDVQIALDRQSASGTSRKIARRLQKSGIPLFLNQGSGLLHHKFAIIDNEILIAGSANWTVGAFTRNREIVLIFEPLLQEQHIFLTKLWHILSLNAKKASNYVKSTVEVDSSF